MSDKQMLIFIKMDVNQLMWLNSMETEFLSCAEKMTINILFYYDLVNQGKGYTFLIKVKLYWNGDEKIADFSFSSAGCFFLSSMSFFFLPTIFQEGSNCNGIFEKPKASFFDWQYLGRNIPKILLYQAPLPFHSSYTLCLPLVTL